MAKLSPAEKVRLERLLEMEGGYVLDFGNDSMARFFADSVGIDIEDRQRYGNVSKARRMRAFWSLETDAVVGKLLHDMIDYRSARGLGSDDDAALVEQCQATAARLLASGGVEISSAPPLDSLSHEFIDEQIEKCKGKLARGDTGGAPQRSPARLCGDVDGVIRAGTFGPFYNNRSVSEAHAAPDASSSNLP